MRGPYDLFACPNLNQGIALHAHCNRLNRLENSACWSVRRAYNALVPDVKEFRLHMHHNVCTDRQDVGIFGRMHVQA